MTRTDPLRKAPSLGSLAALALGGLGALWVAAAPGQGLPGALDLLALAAASVVAPGWLALDALLPRRAATGQLERVALSLGTGFALCVLIGVAALYLPGPLSPARLALVQGLVALALFGLAWLRGAAGRPADTPARAWLQAALVLGLALALRAPGLGYAELQGDEAIVLAKAASAVQGRDDALFVHKKGPAEIATAAQVYALHDRIDESRARLPFLVATLAGLLAFFVLARGMFGGVAATAAGLLLGLNGFFVGFARILQYQGVVFLCGTLALYAFWRLYRDADGDADGDADDGPPAGRGWILLGALCLAAGILAHYDAGLVTPAILYLVWRRWRRAPDLVRGDLRAIGGGLVLGCLALGLFFLPLALHPYFQTRTLPYLVDVRLRGDEGGGAPYNTLRNSATLSLFYNAALYALALWLLLVAEVGRRLGELRSRLLSLALVAAFAASTAALLLRPGWFVIGGFDASILVFLVFGIGLLWLREPPPAWKAAWWWWLAPAIFYATLVQSPRTHIHVVFPAWCLLAALPLAAVDGRLAARRARWLGWLAFAALYAYCAWYVAYAFLRQEPEYRRTYPENQPAGYWMPLPDLPSSGWFGFPYRAGWKAIGARFADGSLRGDYDSNEEPPVTDWYTRGAPRCDEGPRYVFVAENVQDLREIPEDLAAEGYVRVAAVTVAGRPRIAVWERADLRAAAGLDPAGADERWPVEEAQAAFDAEASGSRYDPDLPYDDPLRYVDDRLEARFDGKLRLEGWRIDAEEVGPGERLTVHLYWRTLAPLDKDYQVFLHAEREGEISVGQADGPPRATEEGVCGDELALSRLEPDKRFVDRRILEIDPEAPPGRYPLLVGLYDYETLERLPLLDEAGNPADARLQLGEILVRPATP